MQGDRLIKVRLYLRLSLNKPVIKNADPDEPKFNLKYSDFLN